MHAVPSSNRPRVLLTMRPSSQLTVKRVTCNRMADIILGQLPFRYHLVSDVGARAGSIRSRILPGKVGGRGERELLETAPLPQ